MESKRWIKAIAAMAAIFIVVMTVLILSDPNVNFKKFFSNDEKDIKVEQSYEVDTKPIKDNIDNESNGSIIKPTDEDELYANQILDNSPSYIGSNCAYCGGAGKKKCSACYGTGQSSGGSLCVSCYGEGYIDCEYCK